MKMNKLRNFIEGTLEIATPSKKLKKSKKVKRNEGS